MEQVEQRAEGVFEAFRDVIPDAETGITYHTNVVAGVLEATADRPVIALPDDRVD